ncbi:MAG TPA: response regulator [Terriglobales bacterium]|nr:response regulator [Terriglobales bacterium]
MKVLLIDDSKVMRVACEGALGRAGHQVISAADGDQGLRLVHEAKPDLILLDMMLPKMSGLDLLQTMKQDPAVAAIPVIVFTSLSQKNEAKLLKAGAAAYLEKTEVLSNNSAGLIQAIERITKKTAAV